MFLFIFTKISMPNEKNRLKFKVIHNSILYRRYYLVIENKKYAVFQCLKNIPGRIVRRNYFFDVFTLF